VFRQREVNITPGITLVHFEISVPSLQLCYFNFLLAVNRCIVFTVLILVPIQNVLLNALSEAQRTHHVLSPGVLWKSNGWGSSRDEYATIIIKY